MKDVTGNSSGEECLVPLRKKLKTKDGRECNFMPSYYRPTEAALQRTTEQTEFIKRQYKITMQGEDCPNIILSFGETNLPPFVLSYLSRFKAPTPIQMTAIPCLLSGRDMIGISETGSGKTLAFVLPLLTLLLLQPPAHPLQGPLSIILAPTRELVDQIYSILQEFLQMPELSHFKALGVCGGVPVAGQAQALKEGIDVLVATPGRLLDLVGRGVVLLDRLHYLVIDEVDIMLTNYYPTEEDKNNTTSSNTSSNGPSSGGSGSGSASLGVPKQLGSMEEQLRNFLNECNSAFTIRQTALFTATLPLAVERLARTALLNEIVISIGNDLVRTKNHQHKDLPYVPPNILQNVVFLHTYQKRKYLLNLLRSIEYPPVLIFCQHSATVDSVVSFLRSEQFHVAGLHAEKAQGYRFRVLKAFKNGQLDVLIATDVASRGIHVDNITHVILYDMPDNIETYVHRIGRCGRAGECGESTSFLTYHCKCAKELKKLLKKCKQHIPQQLQGDDISLFGHKVIQTELGDKVLFTTPS